MEDPKYWRIRMKYRPSGEDLSRTAWDRNEVGIWYGAWSANELESALKSKSPLKYLSIANRKHGLHFDITAHFFQAAKRFKGIEKNDWVLVHFGAAIHMAHICSEIFSSKSHPLNQGFEIFKYRKIKPIKSFSLNRLPDAFRLLPAAGRGTVFQLRGSGELVRLLGNAKNEKDVTRQLKSKDLDDFLELLGPTSWESVCQGYLSMEHHFVPTGLTCGGTLSNFDLVGRRSTDGMRILAQCKKNPQAVAIEDSFLEGDDSSNKKVIAFYFAYNGCSGHVPSNVRVIDKEIIRKWSKTPAGGRYFKWFRGE